MQGRREYGGPLTVIINLERSRRHCFVAGGLQHALNMVERARIRRGDP